jgi:elongation factor G
MKVYEAGNIRNIALMGHAGSGKTTLAESILFQTGTINRKGTIEEANTVSDHNEIEHERGSSVYSTPLTAEWNKLKLNILDTPGYDDYAGEVVSAIHIADTGIVILNAQNGVEVGTELGVKYAELEEKPLIYFVNKLDVEQANFEQVFEDIRTNFGKSATVFQYPVNQGAGFNSIVDVLTMKMYEFDAEGNRTISDIPDSEKDTADSYRSELLDSVAESDEDLMNIYFEEGDLTEEQLNNGLKKAMVSRVIMPVICGSTKLNIGTSALLNLIEQAVPAPTELPAKDDSICCDSSKPVSLFAWKMSSDSKLGDMTFFKVISGKITPSTDMIIADRSQQERIGQLFVINGKKRTEVDELHAGDFGATVKLKHTKINDTLFTKGNDVKYPIIEFPNPKVRTAIVPKTKGEEEKVGMALNSLLAEDPSFRVDHSQELRQTILFAQGELHLALAKWRLENRYKVETEYIEPRVPYRETIQSKAKASYRHKKQSGGAGQFAEVHMMVEPYAEGKPYDSNVTVRGKDLHKLAWGGQLEFVNCIVGGVIDQRFLPAIMKGIMDKMENGPLTGSYVRDVRIYVYDGKMHPVDSNEAAFKMAGTMAFKECFANASPKLLEPIYNVSVKVPEEFVGDVMSDLPSRRGVILGIDSEGRYQTVKTKMPLAELDKYPNALRSMTQARASFTADFDEYQPVPGNVQEELINKHKAQQEEDEE